MAEQRTHKPLVGGSNPSSATNPTSVKLAYLALFCSILFWAVLPLILKHLAGRLDAWTVNAARYFFALLFWMPHVLRHRNETFMRNMWRNAVPPAAVHWLGQILFALTPYYNDATIINFVGRTSFLFATLFGFLILPAERPLARAAEFWLGFAGTFAGLSLMYFGAGHSANTSALGMTLLLGAAVCWGLYSVLVRRCMHAFPIRLSYGVISLYAGPAVILVGVMFGRTDALARLPVLDWLLIAGSAVTGLALGHVFFFRAIHTLGPIRAEGSLTLIPFITAVMAVPLLGERLAPVQWVGGVLLIGGCLILLFSRAQKTTGLPPPDEESCLPSLR